MNLNPKPFLVFLILIFTGYAGAQDRKIEVGANLYPNYSISLISNSDPDLEWLSEAIKNSEHGKFNLCGNVFVSYPISEIFSLSVGLGYLHHGEGLSKVDVILAEPDPVLGDITAVRSVFNYHFVEIPVLAKYNFGSRYYLNFGLSGLVNFRNTTTNIHYYGDGSSQRFTDETGDFVQFKRVNGTVNLGMGMDVLEKEQFTLYLQPGAQLGLTGVAKETIINRRLLSFGLNMGIRL